MLSTLPRSTRSTRSSRAVGSSVLGLIRADVWLALFYVLTATQGGHLLEHVAQMVQIHALGLRGPDAHGIVGVLDLELVHLTWNTWVMGAVLALLWRYRSNRWLWVTALFATWHELEHVAIMSVYLSSGVVGSPGLLATGGAIGGGLLVSRPDLHFVYNLAETTPLVLAFRSEVLRALRRGIRPRPVRLVSSPSHGRASSVRSA